MNITELEKITEQIKRYQLEDEIGRIETWLRKLNKKQIKNFISLDIYPLNKISEFKFLLVNQEVLNSDYYLEDMMFVNNAKSDVIAGYLINVAVNGYSLGSKHHKEDMKLIANAKSDYIAKCLNRVAMDKNSLESKHHKEDMELISNARSNDIAICLRNVAMDKNSLESKYHKEDMNLIANITIKTILIARYSQELACNKNSLESKYHKEDMKLISSAKSGTIAGYLIDVACNNNLLKSEHHIEDMKRLLDAKDDCDAKEIYNNIIKQYEVQNKKEESNYVTFQEKIDAIHQNAVEYTDGDTTKELDDSVFTLK